MTALRPLVKKQRFSEGMKILIDIATESSDWFPPLKAALGGVSALIKHYQVLVGQMFCCTRLIRKPQEFEDVKVKIENLKPQLDRLKRTVTTVTIDGDPEEAGRRRELSRCAHQFLAPPLLTVFLVHWKRSRGDQWNCWRKGRQLGL